MSVPEAIKKQNEEALKKHQEVYGKTDEETPPEEPEATPEEPEVPEEEAAPEEVPAVEETPESKKAKELEEELRKANERYSVLQGKYNAEIPRLHEELRNLRSQLEKKPEKKPEQPEKTVDPKDYEDFGDEMVQLVEYTKTQDGVIRELREEVKTLKEEIGNVNNRQTQTDEERFWTTLDNAVPDWEDVNRDKQFLDWLAVKEPLIGASRQDILDNARNSLDSARVITLFKMFKEEKDQANKKSDSLKRQVVPERKKGTAPSDTANKPTFSMGDFRAKMAELDKQRTAGQLSQDAYQKKFNELHTAYREGRVT